MNRTTLRWLTVLVIVMGGMIVAGLATLAALIVTRSFAPAAPLRAVTLAEPQESRITGVSLSGGLLALSLSGGGPERVLLIEAKTGRVLGRIALSAPAEGAGQRQGPASLASPASPASPPP
jgi:hypothetical protein